jgi:hypothetical protein
VEQPGAPNFNDQYYDLDDDFIDDDLVGNGVHDDMVADLHANETIVYSEQS